MKELSTEEKAKAYDEALKQIKECTPDENGFITIYPNEIFPELKESEDERIRKNIITYLKQRRDRSSSIPAAIGSWIAWLEKQGEQKPAEWEPQTGDTFRKKGTTSPTYHLCDKREDGITFGFVENREVGISGGEITIFTLRKDYELVERPKSIEDIVEEELNKGLQTKVEQKPAWSEEDEKLINRIEGWLDTLCDYLKDSSSECVADVKDIIGRLKSLRPQNRWKPSDEQMKALNTCIMQGEISYVGQGTELQSLYNDLKKLTE